MPSLQWNHGEIRSDGSFAGIWKLGHMGGLLNRDALGYQFSLSLGDWLMNGREKRDLLGGEVGHASGRRRLWTIDDLADFLGVPVATVYKWRHTNEGPPGYRIGRYLRFDEKEVIAWLETRRSTLGED